MLTFKSAHVAGKEAVRTSIFGGIQRTLGLNPLPDLPRFGFSTLFQICQGFSKAWTFHQIMSFVRRLDSVADSIYSQTFSNIRE